MLDIQVCRIIGYRARRFFGVAASKHSSSLSRIHVFQHRLQVETSPPKTDQTALSKERRKPISNAEPIVETQLNKWPINPHLLHPKTKQSTASLRQVVNVFVYAQILNVDSLEFSKQIAVPARTPNLLATEAFQLHV